VEEQKEYKMIIEPKILEFLGPNLYTNIYYILAELIANSYDADAENVYLIIRDDMIIVEDDGVGMSYNDISANFLNVAVESRKSSADSTTKTFNRKRMGRKGIGKLAALSVSEYVDVMTIKNKLKNGFQMTTHIDNTGLLQSIGDNGISFERITEHGTSIKMRNPKFKINKSPNVIAKNLQVIFPIFSKDFKLHIINGNSEPYIVESPNQDLFDKLSTLITIGSDFSSYKISNDKFCQHKKINLFSKKIKMLDKNNFEVERTLEVKGWIGTYKSVKGTKNNFSDFQENHLSIFANGKLGEFNVLPKVGGNKLIEVYIVGELHVDIFEDSDLVDMSLSNREGYKTDDLRYVESLKIFKKLLDDTLKLHSQYIDEKNKEKSEQKILKLKQMNEKLNTDADKFKNDIKSQISNYLKTNNNDSVYDKVIEKIPSIIDISSDLLGLKTEVDASKKKILISHTSKDKTIANIVYEMLKYNGIKPSEIIYSSSDDEEARFGSYDIYDYLRSFFVKSISKSDFYVIYITSKAMGSS
jgi:hypothetical protein